ncbi:sugar ABC transporter substrate-binding protein [Vibrio sp. MACH09]|uniref:ABC transporter substrate-binding protein n=1 Tax=Vibrio sp. MACH09 TaxID=3025122 RepID=UPI00278CDB81|nr:ABC transporter substrate-binding protein [Vibrio sp. MACH09]GLO63506.1 sugar ABC transporter substrate-binding protein [Vibrio sp. MACH09]
MKKILFFIMLLSNQVHAKEVEFLHWWTSDGEMAALDVMKDAVKVLGDDWKSTAIRGGGGDTAMAVLQARAIAGNPPTMAQIEGPAIKSWAKIGFLTSLDEIAQKEKWDELMLPAIQRINKYNGGYVAIPVTVHRVNWLWVNMKLLKEAGLDVPTTWNEFISVSKVLNTKGIKPLALGNAPWQISMLFENIALGLGGPDYYQKALVDLSPDALNSSTTTEVLSVFRQIGDISKNSLKKQTWDEATHELLNDQAVFQVLGDWVIGELNTEKISIPDHIACYVSPQTSGTYIYNMDSFVIFNHNAGSLKADSDRMAKLLSAKTFQEEFSKKKGSIPARADVSLSSFNRCSQQSRRDFDNAEENNRLLPSMTDSMAVAPVVQNAIINELYQFFNDPTKQPEQLISRLIAIAGSHSG